MYSIKGTVLSIAVTSIVMGGYLVATRHFEQLAAKQQEQFEQFAQRIARLERDGNPGGVLSTAAPAPDLGRQLDELRGQLAELNRHQARLQQSMDALQLDSGSEDTEPTAVTDIDVDGLEASDFSQNRALEDHFQTDYIDSGWAAAAETTLQAAFSDEVSGGFAITSAECRSTVCRIDVRFDDAKSRMEGMPFLAMLIPWTAESHIRSDTDGEGAVVYVAREGHSLTGKIMAEPVGEESEGPG